jgi:hypothetical protein
MFNGCRKVAALAVIAAGFFGARQASAADVTVGLETLLSGGSNEGGVTVGDKKFSGFTFSSSASGGATALRPEDVDVIIMSEGNRHDLTFMFDSDMTASNGQRADLVIGYRLDALGGGLVRRVDAMFDGGPFGAGDGRSAATVIETVSTVDGSDLVAGGPVQSTELLTLFNDGEAGLPDTQEAALDIIPARSLLFTKDILVSSRPNSAMVGISVVQNGVEQTNPIPLPAAFWAAIPVFGAVVGRKKLAKLALGR